MTTAIGLTPKRLALASEGLGASEVPTALGLNPWMAPAELAAVKRGEIPPFAGNEFTRWGNRLERPIADEWLDRHREAGEDVSIFTPPTLRHPTCPTLFATPDRVIVPEGRRAREVWKGLLEIKALSAYRQDEFNETTGEVPEAMQVQVQVQLEVCNLDTAFLVPLLGGQKYLEFPQVRDRELGENLVQFSMQWWADHVVQGLPFPADGTPAFSAYLKRRFPKETEPLLPANDEFVALVERLRAAKAAAARADEYETELGNELRAAIGLAAGVEGLCTFKFQKGTTYTVTRADSRVLRLTKEKKP